MTLQYITFSRIRRPLLVAGALLCYTAAVVLAPTDVRSQLDVRRPAAIAEPVMQTERPLAAIVPSGDAFAPRAEVEDDAPPPMTGARLPRLPQPPPNRARRANAAAPLRTQVTAIVTGSHSTAIVESGGAVRAVTVGDPLDRSTIVSIDDDAIWLADGRRLLLGAAAPAP